MMLGHVVEELLRQTLRHDVRAVLLEEITCPGHLSLVPRARVFEQLSKQLLFESTVGLEPTTSDSTVVAAMQRCSE